MIQSGFAPKRGFVVHSMNAVGAMNIIKTLRESYPHLPVLRAPFHELIGPVPNKGK
jgi:hypothetical protein